MTNRLTYNSQVLFKPTFSTASSCVIITNNTLLVLSSIPNFLKDSFICQSRVNIWWVIAVGDTWIEHTWTLHVLCTFNVELQWGLCKLSQTVDHVCYIIFSHTLIILFCLYSIVSTSFARLLHKCCILYEKLSILSQKNIHIQISVKCPRFEQP